MIVTVNDRWRIQSDARCWIVQERTGLRKDGTSEWRNHAYCQGFDGALHELAQRRVRMVNGDDIEHIRVALKEIVSECRKASEVFRNL